MSGPLKFQRGCNVLAATFSATVDESPQADVPNQTPVEVNPVNAGQHTLGYVGQIVSTYDPIITARIEPKAEAEVRADDIDIRGGSGPTWRSEHKCRRDPPFHKSFKCRALTHKIL